MSTLVSPSVAPTLAALADHYQSDKGFGVMGGHGYTRVYDHLFAPVRQAPLRVLEIGLLHPITQAELRATGATTFSRAPSLDMWADFLPNAQIVGLDLLDFSGYRRDRVRVVRADQGDRASLHAALAPVVGDGFDVIIEDGSHASHHQQVTLGALWPMLKPGGVFIMEDLQWQPPELEPAGIVKTRRVLQALQATGDLGGLPTAFAREERLLLEREARNVAFFDSLDRLNDLFACRDALAVIFKAPR